ncbi:LysR family transcriptional regulator [Colwelliaceae bacterium 6471]
MDLKNLHYFVSVYEKQSFSAAAKTCFIAQPSISAAIHQLEQSLDTSLFIRHARGVTPTDTGERLYPLAKQLLGQADAIKNVFTDQSIKKPFYLGVTRGLGVERMSALLKDFTSAQELMELTLVPHHEACDARIIIKEELRETESFVPLWQEEYLLALPYNHVLAINDSISMSDLDGLPFIKRSPCNAWDSLNDTLTLAGITLDIRAKIQTIDYALGLVHAGLGAALVPASPEILKKFEIVFLPIDGIRLVREVVFAYQQSSDIVETLKQLVIKHRQ